MPCYHPILGYRSVEVGKTGKRKIIFSANKAYVDLPVKLPCGQCIGCRLEKARQWAIRCVHEASLWEKNCFITLTYNDDNLPANGSVSKREFQLFMKRLRKKYNTHKIRYYACGEYGEKYSRPHYHACLFGFDFDDKKVLYGGGEYIVYRSAGLEDVWKYGFSSIGELTFESAGYVARYVMKKLIGPRENEYGEKEKEFALMSRRKGIGNEWINKYKRDVYPKDFLTIRGKKMKPPMYYDNILEGLDPEMYKEVKEKRAKYKDEDDGRRLLEREKYKELQTKTLIRSYENGTEYL